jgi:NarL family two-component system response regulator LiaR
MLLTRNRKEIITYGVALAALLFLLKWLEVHFVILNYRIEFFVAAIAIIFTVLGIWLALKLAKPKVETRIIEKEIYIEAPASSELNLVEIENLGISKRELEVLSLMAEGLSNDEIAQKLFVSLNTIKTHSSNLFLKLEVKRRTQAVEKARRLKIIQ